MSGLGDPANSQPCASSQTERLFHKDPEEFETLRNAYVEEHDPEIAAAPFPSSGLQ